jgi:hypothetical protein
MDEPERLILESLSAKIPKEDVPDVVTFVVRSGSENLHSWDKWNFCLTSA